MKLTYASNPLLRPSLPYICWTNGASLFTKVIMMHKIEKILIAFIALFLDKKVVLKFIKMCTQATAPKMTNNVIFGILNESYEYQGEIAILTKINKFIAKASTKFLFFFTS